LQSCILLEGSFFFNPYFSISPKEKAPLRGPETNAGSLVDERVEQPYALDRLELVGSHHHRVGVDRIHEEVGVVAAFQLHEERAAILGGDGALPGSVAGSRSNIVAAGRQVGLGSAGVVLGIIVSSVEQDSVAFLAYEYVLGEGWIRGGTEGGVGL